jgi:diguanylate cyclase (GGDEF)-like protein
MALTQGQASLAEWRVPATLPPDASTAQPPSDTGADVPPQVHVEQVRLIYQHPALILGNIINSLLVVAVLWQRFPHPALLLWFGLFLIVIPIRLLIAYLQARDSWPAARAARWSVAGSAITGCLWGLLALAIVAEPDVAYRVFIVFVLGGMTAGAVLLDASYLPAFFAFVLPIMLAAIPALLIRGDLMSFAMGIMLATFGIIQAVVGYRANQWILNTLRLQLQRENLTSELTRREIILRIMANHDELTGVFNRHYLLATMRREMLRARRSQAPITIAMLDIDHFKNFNDNFGHEAGDNVLRAIGALLLRSVRGSDIVCRYGGEEFVWVFLDCSLEQALPRLSQLAQDMREMQCACRGKPLPCVTVSIGVAQFPLHAQSLKKRDPGRRSGALCRQERGPGSHRSGRVTGSRRAGIARRVSSAPITTASYVAAEPRQPDSRIVAAAER